MNHPSRAGVLPNMSSGDVAVGNDHTEEYVNLLCRFHLSFLFLDSEWHDFPPPL